MEYPSKTAYQVSRDLKAAVMAGAVREVEPGRYEASSRAGRRLLRRSNAKLARAEAC